MITMNFWIFCLMIAIFVVTLVIFIYLFYFHWNKRMEESYNFVELAIKFKKLKSYMESKKYDVEKIIKKMH